MPTVPQTLGAIIKQARGEHGLTVRDVAAELGKSPGYVSRIETRGEIPSPDLICVLAEVLELDAERLLDAAKRDLLRRTTEEIRVRHEAALQLYRKAR